MVLQIQDIPVDQIVRDETAREPERRLVQSLAAFGQFEPIHVVPPEGGRFELIDGSRRVAAARTLGWQEIAAIVETPDDASRPRDLKAIIVNTQRKNLRQLHVARHARRLIEQGHYKQAELARELHLSPGTLSSMLKVLECPDLVQAMESDGLEFGAARALASLGPTDRSAMLAHLTTLKDESASGKFPSVRQVEQMVRERNGRAPLVPAAGLPLGALIEGLLAHGAEMEVRTVRASHTRLKVTLTIAEEDQAWVNDLLAETKESEPPSVQPRA